MKFRETHLNRTDLGEVGLEELPHYVDIVRHPPAFLKWLTDRDFDLHRLIEVKGEERGERVFFVQEEL